MGVNETVDDRTFDGAEYQLYAHEILPFNKVVKVSVLYEIPFFLLLTGLAVAVGVGLLDVVVGVLVVVVVSLVDDELLMEVVRVNLVVVLADSFEVVGVVLTEVALLVERVVTRVRLARSTSTVAVIVVVIVTVDAVPSGG